MEDMGVLTCDLPPAPSTARVTERAQQMTWILKKDPKKLLQPRASISCGGGTQSSQCAAPVLPCRGVWEEKYSPQFLFSTVYPRAFPSQKS